MSDVLRFVAHVHRSRLAKAEAKRLAKQKKLTRCQAYFKDTEIMAMWDDVKDIKIQNPVPEEIDGLSVTFADLVVQTDHDYQQKTGLSLYGKKGDVMWYVEDANRDDQDLPENVYYCADVATKHIRKKVTEPDAKKKFVESFIYWLAKYITPTMLAEMNVDLSTPSVVKKSRKILQLTES